MVNKYIKIILFSVNLSLIFTFLGSCSILEKRGALIDNSSKKKKIGKVVSKKKYDELALKYSELLKKSKTVNTKLKSDKKIDDKERENLTKSLEALSAENELEETVDVFSKKPISKKEYLNYGTEIKPNFDGLNAEILKIRKSEVLLAQKKYDSALTILKELDISTHRQIQVRAKFLIGELLFLQSEYDLALQVFEEIISKDAFSGVVLKALGRMIVCAQKLGQVAKKEKYYSILHDFFETAS